MELRHSEEDVPSSATDPRVGIIEEGVDISSNPSAASGSGRDADLAGVDCLAEGVATHMIVVLKETSATEELSSLPAVPLDFAAVLLSELRGTFNWFLGAGMPLDCFEGVVNLLRNSCLAVGFGSILAGLGT